MADHEAIGKPDLLTSTGLSFYVIVTVVITLVSYLLYKRQQKINRLNLIPGGPKPMPIIGNAWDLYGTPVEFFAAVRTKFCNNPCGMTRVWIASEPYCLVYRANVVEKILSSSKYIDKSIDYTALHPWLGTGLLTSTGAKWQHRRKMLTPTFHFKILEDFIDIFNQQSFIFIEKLKQKADGTPFNIFHPITLCTLDIIMETAMGRCINAQDNSDSDYVKAIYEMGIIVIQRSVRPWLGPDILFKLFGYAKWQEKCLKILHGLAYETIQERRKEFEISKKQNKSKEEDEVLGKKKRLVFLDMLLENNNEEGLLSDEEIREEVDTFMFEGHDTTAAGINWSIYLLGSHQEIQKRVCEELDAIFGDSDRPATSADLREMKYLECCIKEALRIFPSVPVIGRKLKEDVTVDGYTIPSDTSVLIVKYCLHRDPAYFPDPEEFKPERFFPENAVKRHPFAYVPFSAGPRNCIGQKFALLEEKTVLSAFFRKYRVESLEKREDLLLTGNLILRPENGTSVKIFPRK